MSHTVRPTPGWYADPSDSQLLRWWNGTQWSEHTQPMPSRPVLTEAPSAATLSVRTELPTGSPTKAPPSDSVAETPPSEVPPPTGSPVRNRRRRTGAIVVVLLVMLVAGSVGWYLWQRQQSSAAASLQTTDPLGAAPVSPADGAVPGSCTDVVSALTADGTSTQLATQLQSVAAGADLADTAGFLASIGPVTGDLMANSGAACLAAVNAGQGPAAYAVFINSFQAAMTGGTELVNAGLAQPGGLSVEQKAQLSKQASELSGATSAVTKDAPVAPAAPPAG
ncbi:MAG: DUF2510 domain-containing protein [Candidatus Nanopelagicales bacterium]